MLGRIRKNINIYTEGTVYTSFVLPILDYWDTVWSCYGSVNTNSLEKLEARSTYRYTFGEQRNSAKFLRFNTQA